MSKPFYDPTGLKPTLFKPAKPRPTAMAKLRMLAGGVANSQLAQLDDNGGAQPASEVPHAGKAVSAALGGRRLRAPKALPLKKRKKLLAAKLRASG